MGTVKSLNLNQFKSLDLVKRVVTRKRQKECSVSENRIVTSVFHIGNLGSKQVSFVILSYLPNFEYIKVKEKVEIKISDLISRSYRRI